MSSVSERDSLQTPLSSLSDETVTKIITRDDGIQMVSVNDGDNPLDLAFQFPGSFLEKLPSGHILVRPAEGEEPTSYIDPAWAQDVTGNPVQTSFEVNGDKLIQHIASSPSSSQVVSDPYIRDVKAKNGRKIGQELVFSKDETSLIAVGGLPACIKYGSRGGPVAAAIATVGCGGALMVASHATNTGRCLTIRALGAPDAPNVIFPYATRC